MVDRQPKPSQSTILPRNKSRGYEVARVATIDSLQLSRYEAAGGGRTHDKADRLAEAVHEASVVLVEALRLLAVDALPARGGNVRHGRTQGLGLGTMRPTTAATLDIKQ